jgi:glycosyltransferase involved in cell wall biosynthesis
MTALLRSMDEILAPSEAAAKFHCKAYPELKGRVRILAHDLSHLAPHVRTTASVPQRVETIALVGNLEPRKGMELVFEAVPLLKRNGFRVVLLGRLVDRLGREMPPVDFLEARPYRSVSELAALFDQVAPQLVAFPALWAETFCFAFYEALFLAECGVPVVSPLGHPADVVRRERIGVVMDGLTARSLVSACIGARAEHGDLLAAKRRFVSTLATERRDAYLSRYLEIALRAGAGQRRHAHDLAALLAHAEEVSRASENLEAIRPRLEEALRRNEHLAHDLGVTDKALQAMRASTSWRLTAPLRAVVRLFSGRR